MKRVVVGAAVVILLALGGVVPARAQFDFEACRLSMGRHVLAAPLLEVLTKDLLGMSSLGARPLRFNQPFDPEAINVLMPAAEAKATWNEMSCGDSPLLARCWSFPSTRVVVCSPGFTAWLARSNYFGAPMRLEIALAGRFMMHSVLGHEIAHLERGGEGARHVAPNTDGMRCGPLPVRDGSEEVASDRRGAEIACAMARTGDAWQRLLRSQNGRITLEYGFELIGRVRREIRDFAPDDDACTGNESYESFSLRLRRLSQQLFDCLLDAAKNPFSDTLREETDDFMRLEEALRVTQAFVARSGTLRLTTTPARGMRVTNPSRFDSGGSASSSSTVSSTPRRIRSATRCGRRPTILCDSKKPCE